jgi:3-oxoacyl-[acyl-carrier protein] reductase
MEDLNEKTILVTGASRGIGLAIAERAGRMGASVAICARDARRLEEARNQLKNQGIRCFAQAADVTSAKEAAMMVQETGAELGPIDILVNNAGMGIFRPTHELSEEDWDTVMNTNLKGVFLMSRAVVPAMIERGSGQIINIASLAAKNAFAGGAAYCASKWGLLGLTHAMVEDLRGYGIRVAAVCPGSVDTEFSPHTGKDASRMLKAEDVANVVAMMLTENPRAFTSEVNLRPTHKP